MQPETKNKEHFKLLQYSDDSKSLSDLELTEIVVPRKRKVRRKTKPKNGHRHKKGPTPGPEDGPGCKHIGVWVALASSVGWLLILSYIVSMIHSEYTRLDRETSKLSTTVKALPNEWHDQAHALDVNQSTLFRKLFDVQLSLQNLTEDFVQLKNYVQQPAPQSTTFKVNLLENSVAEFGAKLSAITVELDQLKQKLGQVQGTAEQNAKDSAFFSAIVIQRNLNSTEVPAETLAQNQTAAQLEALRALEANLSAAVERMNASVLSREAVQSQQIASLVEKNVAQKKAFNDLVSNQTTHIGSEEMTKYRESVQQLDERVGVLERSAISFNASIGDWQTQMKAITAQVDDMMKEQAAQVTPPSRRRSIGQTGDDRDSHVTANTTEIDT